MTTALSEVIVLSDAFECEAVHTTRIHHRDFPDVWTSAGSPVEAAEHLIKKLTCALDSAPGDWHGEALQHAIADVREFLGHHVPSAAHP
jgi:hypothetical protein